MIRFLAFYILISGFLCQSCSSSDNDEKPEPETLKEFIRGTDLSFLPQIEVKNIEFTDNGETMDVLNILKNHDVNTVRLRIWHTPSNQYSSFAEVKEFSNRIKSHGLKVWLTVHYSDTWADPGNQILPQAWQNLNIETLKDSVYQYTEKIIKEIQPEYIQIGNEINSGILFPHGERSSSKSQFITLLTRGIQAVRDNSPDTQIILHYAGIDGADSFFNDLIVLNYDIIGLSYYPIWHGKDLNHLESMISLLQNQFNKQVLIAETAYPFTLDWNDWTNNIIGSEEQLILPEYPATPEGQKDFMLKIREITETTNALGFCYWGAEWVAFDGPQSKKGSNWENQALFDFKNEVLPAIEAFQKI